MLNSRETELSVLGTIMYHPELFVKTTVTPEDFFYPEHAQVFSAMSELHGHGRDINIKTVWNLLYQRGYSGTSEKDIEDMLLYRVDKEAFVTFVDQLSEFSGFRLLETGVKRIDGRLQKKDLALDEYTSMLSKLVHDVNLKQSSNTVANGEAFVEAYMEMVTRDQTKMPFSGISAIDSRILDFAPKELTYIAGRPGQGKSQWLLQSARANLEKGFRVGFLSLEMSVAKLLNRLISSTLGVNGENLLKQTEDLLPGVRDALFWYRDKPLFIDDRGPFNMTSVIRKIRKLVYENGCDVVYVDYVGLIAGTPGVSRNEQLSEISRSLKEAATDLNIPIIVAAQLNREVVKRGGIPNLADLRDSGSLEQDASIVAFIYADRSALGDVGSADDYLREHSDIPVRFDVQKQRNGATFYTNLTFHKTVGTFTLRDDDLATY